MYQDDNSRMILPKKVSIKANNNILEAGIGCKTLVMALIGSSFERDYSLQLKKIKALNKMNSGPDIIADLSIVKISNALPLWKVIVEETPHAAAVLPVYTARDKNAMIDPNHLVEVVHEQMEGGVGMITIHPTPNKQIIDLALKRLTPWTSRGGGIIIKDLQTRGLNNENVYMEILPQIIKMAIKYGTVVSLGASFRSSNIFDSFDEAQTSEINEQLRIAKMLEEQGVNVVIESPGHARPSDIKKVSTLLKQGGYPIMPLGPIPTDISIGQDHISSAIGATIMGMEGAAHILAAVTREEHTGGVPSISSTIEAVEAARVAAHIIDLHVNGDDESDQKISKIRANKRSCVIDNIGKGCSRCNIVCPL